jgi:SAM-dependent methyltransferase
MKAGKEYWDREARAFDAIYSGKKSRLGKWLDRIFRWDMFGRFHYAMRQAEPAEGRSFLDAGCGSGWYSLELARRGARMVVGVDFSEKIVALARERAEKELLADRATFVVADFMEFEPVRRERKEKFDVCLALGYFDYVRDARPVMEKLKLQAKEKVVASFPRLWSWRAPVRKVRLGLKGCPVFFYSRAKVERLLSETRFERFEIEKIGQLWCVTAYVP